MTDMCWHCGEPIAEEDYAQEEVVDLPSGDGWAAVHANGCPRHRLPMLVEQYSQARTRAELAEAEVDRLKTEIDRALGETSQLIVAGYELRRVEGTLMRKWDNRQLNELVYALRLTENAELAEAIAACRIEEPRRGYLRLARVRE